MEWLTFLGGLAIGMGISYLVIEFCKYKYWIRETTNEERIEFLEKKEAGDNNE
jgi:hypothetical protein